MTELAVPERFQKVFKKAYEKKSMRAAVNSKCLDCTCFQVKEIRDCSVHGCPLWKYRPYQNKSSGVDS